MMESPRVSLLLLVLAAAQVLLALEVTPGSTCAAYCLDEDSGDAYDAAASTTNTTDITCKDIDYSITDEGIKFKTCMECLQKSEKVNETETDLKWFVYNLRYTLSTCLFSTPDAPAEKNLDSPCVIDTACQPLKTPLTVDDLDANPETSWDYCDTKDRLFQGQYLWPCISCLQSSGDQTYLSNFMIALESGCKYPPKDGALLELSGTVFTKSAVNITAPVEDIREKPQGAGSATMTTGTIVGIAVGISLLLLGAAGLFFAYWRRKKAEDRRQGLHRLGSTSNTPDPFFPPDGGVMSQSIRSYGGPAYEPRDTYMPNDGGNEPAAAIRSTGEYYDKMEDEIRAGRVNYAFNPRTASRGPNSLIPTHQAYDPQTFSKKESQTASIRNPSPPATVHRHKKSNTPDSFVLQTYLAAIDDHNPHTSIRAPPPTRLSVSPERRTISNIPPPPPPAPKIPSISLPSIPKIRVPKKYKPPKLSLQQPTPVEDSRGQDQYLNGLQISDPVMTSDARFQDTPLGGGVVFATKRPESQLQARRDDYRDVTVHSGKSTLYGM